MDHHLFNRDAVIRVFFFGAFALILYQLCLLAQPFLTAMLGAAMLAIMFYPLHRRSLRVLRNRNLAAFFSTAGVLLLAVLPLLGLGWFFIRESAELAPAVGNFLEDLRSRDWPTLEARFPGLVQHAAHYLSDIFVPMNVDLKQVVLDHAQSIGAQVTTWGTQVLKHILVTLMNALILSVALFFAFRDGEKLLAWAFSLIPMQIQHKQVVANRVNETFRAVVIGSFLAAAAQGAAAMLGYLLAGVKLPVVLGIATSMASMIGFSGLVTLPVALSALHESTGRGVFLLVWAFGVIGFLDHFLKPILIGSRAHMPFILIFFSIVGGIKLYGLLGFILGPILVASFLSFIKIYQKEYDEP